MHDIKSVLLLFITYLNEKYRILSEVAYMVISNRFMRAVGHKM